MKLNLKSAVVAITALVSNVLYAQLQFSSSDLATIESASTLSPGAMPSVGTFYSAANPTLPPMPVNVLAMSGWSLGEGYYLLDDLSDGGAGGGFHAMDDSEPPIPDGGGGGPYEFTNTYSFPTNGLWLQITNVSDNIAYANLNGATDTVYEIFSTTNLAVAMAAISNWDIATEVFPGTSTNTVPFSVFANGRPNFFLWARDWTGITSHGNTTPDWWLFYWFGSDGLSLSDTNLDSSGNTLLYDYENGFDPNVIQFSVSVTNQYVSTVAPMQLNVTAGQPFYIATLVDDTNFADAAWDVYTSSNVVVSPSSLQGWHNVYVGLRGLAANATQMWEWQHLDFVSAPFLVITNPIASVVDEPIVQIYGYAQEQLANLTYDISNASGTVTNESGFVTDEYFDTNQLGITTNYFQCLDVPLTNGLNVVTVHATDFAGDTTVSNFDFTLDYSSKTNPPVVQFTWPQPGTEISGTNCIFTGSISDPTATLIAQVLVTNVNFTNLFTNGVYTNVYTASVDRAGNFVMANIPLNPGTNAFSITAVDAAGNVTTTNLSVVQTNFVLTMDPQPPISQPTVSVSGVISDPTYAIWVNGVKGENNGDGTWSANNVPATNGNFTVTAYGPTEQQPDGSYGN
jgi:hypothetical protein